MYELIFLEYGNISCVIKCAAHCAIPSKSTSWFIYIYIYVCVLMVNPDLEARSSGRIIGSYCVPFARSELATDIILSSTRALGGLWLLSQLSSSLLCPLLFLSSL
jgi:hypothetical protein